SANHFGGGVHHGLRNLDALGFGSLEVDEEVKILAALRGHLAGVFALENARDHAAGLATDVVVVETKGGDRAPLHAIGIGGDQRRVGFVADLDESLVGRDHVVVGAGVDDVDIADQPAGGRADVHGTRRGG